MTLKRGVNHHEVWTIIDFALTQPCVRGVTLQPVHSGGGMTDRAVPSTIDDYIAESPEAVRPILEEIRRVIRAAAPDATEGISYRMPAFKGRGILVYFAAFKAHIGMFPPVSGEPALERAIAPYAGPKGNLRFPLDRPMPYDLIRRIVRLRAQQDAAKASVRPAKSGAKRPAATRLAAVSQQR